MADKIVDGDTYDWTPNHMGGAANKGKTKYQHLLDGNARVVDIRDYGHHDPTNFLIAVRRVARDRGFTYRAKVVDSRHAAFQVTGKREQS